MNKNKHEIETIKFFANRFNLMALDIMQDEMGDNIEMLPEVVINAIKFAITMEIIERYKLQTPENSLLIAIQQHLENTLNFTPCKVQNN